MKRNIVAVAISLLALLATSPNVLAEDGKIHPGSLCVPYYGTHWEYFQLFQGGLWQVEFGGSIQVQCPIVRDNVLNTNGTKVVRVSVIGSGVECTLLSANSFGDTVAASPSAQSSGNRSELTLDVNGSAGSGIYYLDCRLPRLTGIASYRVDEF
jgi:hypothetical protein